jgi:hypothetical protein
VIGGFIALFSLISWLRANRNEIARMPNRQHTDTAPIPLSGHQAAALRSEGRSP